MRRSLAKQRTIPRLFQLAPGIVAGVGYQYDRFNAQLNALGTSGVMFTFGYDLLR